MHITGLIKIDNIMEIKKGLSFGQACDRLFQMFAFGLAQYGDELTVQLGEPVAFFINQQIFINLLVFCTPALRQIVALEQRVRHRGNPHECRHR